MAFLPLPEVGADELERRQLALWKEEDLFRALREGRRPDGSVIDPNKMPWVRSGLMTDDEIRAVWTYMRSVPAAPMKD